MNEAVSCCLLRWQECPWHWFQFTNPKKDTPPIPWGRDFPLVLTIVDEFGWHWPLSQPLLTCECECGSTCKNKEEKTLLSKKVFVYKWLYFQATNLTVISSCLLFNSWPDAEIAPITPNFLAFHCGGSHEIIIWIISCFTLLHHEFNCWLFMNLNVNLKYLFLCRDAPVAIFQSDRF